MSPTTAVVRSIVRRAARLVAGLAIKDPAGLSLRRLDELFFAELVDALCDEYGLGRKPAADLLGITPRGLRLRLQRVRRDAAASRFDLTVAGEVLEYLAEKPGASRAELKRYLHAKQDDDVLKRDPELIDGVLHFLGETAKVIAWEGTGDARRYTLGRQQDVTFLDDRALNDVLLVELSKHLGGVTYASLAASLQFADPDALARQLAALVKAQRVEIVEVDGEPRYRGGVYRGLPPEREAQSRRWAAVLAAVDDHIGAVFDTLSTKLGMVAGAPGVSQADVVGGSTYAFDSWPGHPLRAQVLETLARLREELEAQREAVDADVSTPGEEAQQVVVYVGQVVVDA